MVESKYSIDAAKYMAKGDKDLKRNQSILHNS